MRVALDRPCGVHGKPSSPAELREELAARAGRDAVPAVERDGHTDDLADLWDEMTSVRRSQPAGTTW